MKQLRSITVLIMVSITTLAFGQDYAFKVLVNKGKNEVKTADGWQVVKTGASLKSSDELKVTENSYIGLIHNNGKPLEVKQAGKYKVIDLAAKVSGGTSVLTKYTDFILSANTEKKNNLSATGAVHRGPENIKVNLPKAESAIVYNNVVNVNWETDKAPAPYIVTFNSMFGDELQKIETNDNNVTINLSDNGFLNEDNIIVIVKSKADAGKSSVEYTLKRISKADRERIKTTLTEVNDVMNEQTAISKLIQAGFYEKNSLFIDAITAYQEAIKLAPDVQEFKDDYNNFLVRNGIKEISIK